MSDRKKIIEEIASERIGILFELADDTVAKNPELAGRYIKTLRRISSHYKVQIPKEMRNRICVGCNSVMVPGLNSTVRLASSKGYVAWRCNNCGKERHVFY